MNVVGQMIFFMKSGQVRSLARTTYIYFLVETLQFSSTVHKTVAKFVSTDNIVYKLSRGQGRFIASYQPDSNISPPGAAESLHPPALRSAVDNHTPTWRTVNDTE